MKDTKNEITCAEFNKVIEAVKNNSFFDGEVLYLGNLLEVKPVYEHSINELNKLIGYDVYRYADQELMEDEDYDFDSDFITTVYINEN